MRGLARAAVLAVALPALAGAEPDAAPPDPGADPAADPFAQVRGMTVSTPGVGEDWGSDAMVGTLGLLSDLGCNWVAIHPYGGLRDDGTVGRSRMDRMYDDPDWLTRAIDAAHAQGLKILIKPHLAYWGTGFSWRGEIAFEDAGDWARFFATYREWIVRVAVLSREADAFAVGTELDLTVTREDEWRAIIDAVRRETDVPLTYCASWNRYRDVAFWDAVDVIGIQAYFPLVEHDDVPTDAELAAGWARIVGELEAYSAEKNRRVVFAELGYNRSFDAAVRPWSYRTDDDPAAAELQERCLDAALAAVAGSRSVVGAFLWKWFPGEIPRGNFTQSDPRMRAVIARHWRTPGAGSGGFPGSIAHPRR